MSLEKSIFKEVGITGGGREYPKEKKIMNYLLDGMSDE